MFHKMSEIIKRITPDNISFFNFLSYIIILAICYFLFQHGDLFHTSSSSYAYLNGHFSDFYDYNANYVGRNDYLPLIYIIFAIWNIPLKIFGLMHDVASIGIPINAIELLWTKFLLVIFFSATIFVIYKIGKVISSESQKAKYIAIIFATSPIAIFSVFIFGGYDIIGILFTMIGFYYYIQKKYYKFCIAFSLAISIKFFPLIIFIPLLLLAEKRIIHIIKYGAIAISATLLQIAFYFNDVSFRNSYFQLAEGKISGLAEFNLSLVNRSS